MPNKLQDFIAQVKTQGMARTNRFTVILNIPNADSMNAFRGTSDTSEIALYCDQIQLPGVNYSTIASMTFGERRERPYEKLYGDIQMSFYVDMNMKVKKFFDAWIDAIQDPITRKFNYYNRYVSTITIMVEDTLNNTKYNVSVFECFPKTVSGISLDSASKDVMKLQVGIQYKYWRAYDRPDNFTSPAPNDTMIYPEGFFLIPESSYAIAAFNQYAPVSPYTQHIKDFRDAGYGIGSTYKPIPPMTDGGLDAALGEGEYAPDPDNDKGEGEGEFLPDPDQGEGEVIPGEGEDDSVRDPNET